MQSVIDMEGCRRRACATTEQCSWRAGVARLAALCDGTERVACAMRPARTDDLHPSRKSDVRVEAAGSTAQGAANQQMARRRA